MNVNSLITRGYGEGTYLITQGFGPIIIIVPPVPPTPPTAQRGVGQKPHILYVPQSFKFLLDELDITVPYSETYQLGQLSISKLERILVIMDRLEISIPVEERIFLTELIFAVQNVFKLGKLDIIQYSSVIEKLSGLKIIQKKSGVYALDTLKIAKKFHTWILTKDVSKLKRKELIEYLEMLELLESLDE